MRSFEKRNLEELIGYLKGLKEKKLADLTDEQIKEYNEKISLYAGNLYDLIGIDLAESYYLRKSYQEDQYKEIIEDFIDTCEKTLKNEEKKSLRDIDVING